MKLRFLLDTDPGTEDISRSSLTTCTKLDVNLVIILAALLCVLIGALGLNFIVRCALRYSRTFIHEERDTRIGLRKRELRRIPVAVYQYGENIPAKDYCPICLGEFIGGEKVRTLPKCGHVFHMTCIDTWLGAHCSCPTCRGSLVEPVRIGGG